MISSAQRIRLRRVAYRAHRRQTGSWAGARSTSVIAHYRKLLRGKFQAVDGLDAARFRSRRFSCGLQGSGRNMLRSDYDAKTISDRARRCLAATSGLREAWSSVHARQSFEVLVDGAEVVFGQLTIIRPRHDLEQIIAR